MELPLEYILTDTSGMTVLELTAGFNRMFEEYVVPMHLTVETFAHHVRFNSIDLAHSVVLRHEDGRLVGIAFLGIRERRGWCGGFGIVPEFRGKRLSHVLAQAMVEKGRTLGLASLQLEVFLQNPKAQRAYLAAGMEKVAELHTYNIPLASLRACLPSSLPEGYALTEVSCLSALSLEEHWQPTPPRPAWRFETTNLSAALCKGYTLTRQGELCGVLIASYASKSGVFSLRRCVFREASAGRIMLGSVVSQLEPPTADESAPYLSVNDYPDTAPLCELMQSLGAEHKYTQFEMMIRYENL
jgi:GNAT superfamily N-acetyltransferase